MSRIHLTTRPKDTPKSKLDAVVSRLLDWLQSIAIVLGFLLAQLWIVRNTDGAAEQILLCVTVLFEFGLLALRETFSYLRRE
ncbi:MAG: hypothetical protein ACT4QE_02225 [Anaerolineales bacterium]